MAGDGHQLLADADERHPRPSDSLDAEYGTAGFRDRSDKLDYVVFRVGLIAALRSKSTKAVVGLMITASHNPEEDNGVKVVDPMGEMLEPSWEVFTTELVNSRDVRHTLEKVIKSAGDLDMDLPATVVIGRDTRLSSDRLVQSAIDGVTALGGTVQNLGLLTTPQLHYVVRCRNTNGGYGEPSEDGYYSKLTDAFRRLRTSDVVHKNYAPKVRLDGSNGIGALAAKKLRAHLGRLLNVEIFNDGNGKLNYLCGADYVKVSQRPPEGVPLDTGVRCASFDGDADRIVYFYICKSGEFRMLDGDKIAALIVDYLRSLLDDAGLDLNLGLVQTAYANGSSTDYVVNQLKVPVACVPTGVKYCQHRASQYDIGVYFEANGHGTVTFSDVAKETIANAAKDHDLDRTRRDAAGTLVSLIDLINETVGDALSDMLLVETILHAKGWSVDQWNAMYTDLPNRQLKVTVADRGVVKTKDAERTCVQPPGLQEAIDKLAASYKSGRAFVRPSGTEDVVRVYAEASTQAEANRLAHEVGCKVFKLAGGVGVDPSSLDWNDV